MKLFVAGGSGELGRATIPVRVAAGHQVRATARGTENSALVAGLGAEPVDVDLFDPAALAQAIRGTDAVLRLATKIPSMSQLRSVAAWEATNRLRTEGARAMVDAVLAERVGRYVSESVAFVYADGGEEWIDEEHPTDTTGLRILEAAVASEVEAARVTAEGGVGVALRFGSLYSPTSGQTRGAARLARDRLMPVIGRGENYASNVAVADAGAAVSASLGVPAGLYNVVDDEPLRYRDYVATYAVVGAPPPMRVPRAVGKAAMGPQVAPFLLRSLRVSNRRFRDASGWAPRYPGLREGLEAIASTLRDV